MRERKDWDRAQEKVAAVTGGGNQIRERKPDDWTLTASWGGASPSSTGAVERTIACPQGTGKHLVSHVASDGFNTAIRTPIPPGIKRPGRQSGIRRPGRTSRVVLAPKN
ncbi:hypothetical protein GCM10009765_63060 [Fodinicola feengrottensis]|uniref:Uncharacterized protein n=1 Tax=Fodinicola feengrottensis TaxID=435914 RepID=A0ABN2IHR0_9ACTN